MDLDFSAAAHYHEGAFPLQELDVARLVPAMLEATDLLARYDQMLKNLPNKNILLAPMRGQEALASSRMEGTFSTLEEILQLQSEEESKWHEYRSEAMETYLYVRALSFARDEIQDRRPLSISLIKQMHQLLLSFDHEREKSPGSFKTEQDYIAGRGSNRVSYVPIAPEKLDSGMESLLAFINSEDQVPLLRTALSHAEFEALHPFKDGNGRIGRMMVTLMLWQSGVISSPQFYISRYFEAHKLDYIERLRAVSAEGAWEEWCIFFLGAVAEQARQNLEIAENIRSLYDQMKTQFADLLSSRWSMRALDCIFKDPVFRNSRFTQKSGIPPQIAARFSRELLKADLLRTVSEASGRRSAVYSFEPLLELVRI